MTQLLAGTSGFSYKEWLGKFYPEKHPADAMLRYYAGHFATVEIKETTIVPIANVGVVIAYIGREGKDVTGDAFKHGNLVNKGEKGVWVEPLDPGKYPINSYTHRVEIVPTANVVLTMRSVYTRVSNLLRCFSSERMRSA